MANQSGNKMRVSISHFVATVGKNSGKVLYHPVLQLNGTKDLPGLAQHMSEHDSKYNEGDIYAVLVQAVKCIKEFATQGVAVQLGDLGKFVPKIKTTSQLSAEDSGAQDIKVVTLRWRAGERTKNFRSECEFETVPKRANTALLNVAEKAGQSTMSLYTGSGSQSGGSGGSNPGAGGE